MAYLLSEEEMDIKDPYAEFVSTCEEGETLYLPFSYITENEDLLQWLEEELGFDYYGTVPVLEETWENAVLAVEEYTHCEIVVDCVEELRVWAADSLEHSGKFFLRGL